MKLRTRLFLWVSLIFFLAFGVSLAFEVYTTDRNLEEAESELRAQILSLNEAKRQHIKRFLHIALSEDQAKIDSLLLRLGRDQKLGATLFLDAKDIDLVAPYHSVFLFKNAKWIDFIQTTKDSKLTSLFIPIDFPLKQAQEEGVNDEISWVFVDGEFFIGVKLKGENSKDLNLGLQIEHLTDVALGYTIFFDPKAIVDFEEPKEDATAFEKSVYAASLYLKEEKNWKRAAPSSKKEYEPGIECLSEEGEELSIRIVELLQRGDQAMMLSALSSLFPSQAFGSSPFAKEAPKGIAKFPKKNLAGHGIFTSEAFFQKRAFDDAKYLASHPSTKDCEGIGSSIAVIAPENKERVFIGNSLEIKGESGKGYLTVGIDSSEFVQDLVLSVNQDAFLVHGDEVVAGYCSDGTKIHNAKAKIPFQKEMLEKKSGLFEWGGNCYYFLHMIPFKGVDLHFFVLEPKAKAFALMQTIEEGSREVIKSVSLNMRIIAVIALVLVLFLLHQVAKRIAKPIAQLASVTHEVAKGKLEDIEMPEAPKGRYEEIEVLFDSFGNMIKGLKEKEKVKGILNKVVSPEIAEEITKGQVHLGGEEKKITVLFADIRNFTGMTSGMQPSEVVEMLNMCMTKISHVVDDFGGVIDKYVGDEVMALFGAPLEKEDSALKAVLSGLKMAQVLQEWNGERKEQGLQPVEMGIGIHTGVVLVGNMGAENRLNYTVIGSNVNLAARMCAAAARGEVLISKDTLEETHVKEHIEVEELPPTELKGFEESVILYRVIREKNV